MVLGSEEDEHHERLGTAPIYTGRMVMTRAKNVHQDADAEEDGNDAVRLDKWLWAARFFKTRSLAAEAVEGGKIRLNGDRPKRAKEVRVGDAIEIRLGAYEHRVIVRAISGSRGSAQIASRLYEETPESVAARRVLAEQMKSMPRYDQPEGGRPTKKARRETERWRRRD